MIILKKSYVEAELASKTALAGQFRLVVRGPEGDIRRDTGFFDNIILDSGLNRWGTGAVSGGAAIGTGTSTPLATQTGLDAQAAWTTNAVVNGSAGNSGSAPYYGTLTFTYRFALGALNGNYTEVGIGWASGANMFSRALIVDALGNPTTLTVTSAEQLDVTYVLRAYVPTVDTSTVVTIGGVSTTVTGRAANASTVGWGAQMSVSVANYTGNNYTVYSGGIGAITGSPSGTTSVSPNWSVAAYVNNSRTINITSSWSLTQGNVGAGGIGAFLFLTASNGYFQFGFSPTIAKDGTKTMTLNCSYSWARRP